MQRPTVTKRQKSTSQKSTKRYAKEEESTTEEEESTTEQPTSRPTGLSTKMRLLVEQGLPPLPPVPIAQPLLELKKLPAVASSWIGKSPGKIYQIESPEKGTGFNEIAWRDKDGSKLYLENIDRNGTVDPVLRYTLYPNVKSLAAKSGWKNSLPDTIFVKSAGDPKSRMAAKKMVLWLLGSYQSDLKLRNKPILKETKTDLPVGGGSVITFSVKGITQIEPIMGLDTVMHQYSHFFSDDLLAALKTYQVNLTTGVVNGFRVEEVFVFAKGGQEPSPSPMFKEIADAAKDLQSALVTEIAEMKNKTKLTTGPGLDTLNTSLATLKTLQKQVASAIEDGFKNELDTRRWQQWRALNPKPLTEDVTVPGTGIEIGVGGIQSSVFKYELDPALVRRPVVLKYDNNGLNGEAIKAGIPGLNPQQSVRAVAAFKISEQLNLGIIPRTECFVGTDDNGRPKLGQAMEFVTGAIGQRKAGIKNVPVDQQQLQEYEDIVKNPGNHTQYEVNNAQDTLYMSNVKVKGKWYSSDLIPVDIDYGNPVVQKGLSDLQVFDYIIGHADRNAANWIYEKDNNGLIIGVKGIDNDDTFGEKWLPLNPNTKFSYERGSKTPDIPPIVDISMALSILNADFNKDIRPLLAGLSDKEINKAAERFDQVQQQVESRVMNGKIASIAPTGDAGVQAKLEALCKLTGASLTQTLRWGNLGWGNLGIPDIHTEQNSYLGFQIAQKNRLAQKYPGSRGVVPESGDALV